MKIGTKSILFGAHCWFLHPWFVAVAWTKLYGFPWDPRLWVAFFVHDLGYWGKPNMDGVEGEDHVWLGASIMKNLFDPKYPTYLYARTWYGRLLDLIYGNGGPCACRIIYPYYNRFSWHNFCFYHSRFMAKRYGSHFSHLCVADKLSFSLTPRWLYLFLVNITGEIHEYMKLTDTRESAGEGKYVHMNVHSQDQKIWHDNVKRYISAWVNEHKDMRPDSWTPEKTT